MDTDKKLKELILYIADKCKEDHSFGATKLNKILFLADMNAYAFRGTPITGAKYMHKPNGPVAKRMLPACEALRKEKRAEIKQENYLGFIKKKVVPLKGANVSMFTEEELSIVNMAIEETRSYSATQLSQWTHTLNPWLLSSDGEEIPYSSVFVLLRLPIEEDGISWAKKEIRRLGLSANAA
ncbi:MAG: SocA family protein [Candidatus Methylomirabilis sp.]|nr:SocA family protein [Deltaproteobacteria bacterium]